MVDDICKAKTTASQNGAEMILVCIISTIVVLSTVGFLLVAPYKYYLLGFNYVLAAIGFNLAIKIRLKRKRENK